MIEFEWKSITEIPTEHWDKNNAISPRYLVKCKGKTYDDLPIIGYVSYSFVTNKWMSCWCCTSKYVHEVIAWSDIKL